MKQCWSDAEAVASTMPMFKNGVKCFWETACNTVNSENPTRLGGWNIGPAEECLEIEWFDENGGSLGKYRYVIAEVIEKGLEAKPNFLFKADETSESCPFRYLLAMEPMPERSARNSGGLLSHFHFQYASSVDLILKDGKLCNPMWYATMCDGDGTLLEQCNIIRVLHHIAKWDKLP